MRALKSKQLNQEQILKVKNMISMFDNAYQKEESERFHICRYRICKHMLLQINEIPNLNERELFKKIVSKKYHISQRLQLLKEHNVSITKFLEIRKDLGLRIPFGEELKNELIQEIVKLRDEGYTYSKLSKKYHMPFETLKFMITSYQKHLTYL